MGWAVTASPADRQRLKRQRRAERGEAKVELWLTAEEIAWVRQIAKDNDDSAAEIVRWCVCTVMADRA